MYVLDHGCWSEVGSRPKNDDVVNVIDCGSSNIAWVLDGHGIHGQAAAISADDSLVNNVVMHCMTKSMINDECILSFFDDMDSSVVNLNTQLNSDFGTTATISVVSPESVTISWCGDSPAFFIQLKPENDDEAPIPLTSSHSIHRSDEISRLKRDGAEIIQGRVHAPKKLFNKNDTTNLNLAINMTRALGHQHLRRCGLMPIPEIAKTIFQPHLQKYSKDNIEFNQEHRNGEISGKNAAHAIMCDTNRTSKVNTIVTNGGITQEDHIITSEFDFNKIAHVPLKFKNRKKGDDDKFKQQSLDSSDPYKSSASSFTLGSSSNQTSSISNTSHQPNRILSSVAQQRQTAVSNRARISADNALSPYTKILSFKDEECSKRLLCNEDDNNNNTNVKNHIDSPSKRRKVIQFALSPHQPSVLENITCSYYLKEKIHPASVIPSLLKTFQNPSPLQSIIANHVSLPTSDKSEKLNTPIPLATKVWSRSNDHTPFQGSRPANRISDESTIVPLPPHPHDHAHSNTSKAPQLALVDLCSSSHSIRAPEETSSSPLCSKEEDPTDHALPLSQPTSISLPLNSHRRRFPPSLAPFLSPLGGMKPLRSSSSIQLPMPNFLSNTATLLALDSLPFGSPPRVSQTSPLKSSRLPPPPFEASRDPLYSQVSTTLPPSQVQRTPLSQNSAAPIYFETPSIDPSTFVSPSIARQQLSMHVSSSPPANPTSAASLPSSVAPRRCPHSIGNALPPPRTRTSIPSKFPSSPLQPYVSTAPIPWDATCTESSLKFDTPGTPNGLRYSSISSGIPPDASIQSPVHADLAPTTPPSRQSHRLLDVTQPPIVVASSSAKAPLPLSTQNNSTVASSPLLELISSSSSFIVQGATQACALNSSQSSLHLPSLVLEDNSFNKPDDLISSPAPQFAPVHKDAIGVILLCSDGITEVIGLPTLAKLVRSAFSMPKILEKKVDRIRWSRKISYTDKKNEQDSLQNSNKNIPIFNAKEPKNCKSVLAHFSTDENSILSRAQFCAELVCREAARMGGKNCDNSSAVVVLVGVKSELWEDTTKSADLNSDLPNETKMDVESKPNNEFKFEFGKDGKTPRFETENTLEKNNLCQHCGSRYLHLTTQKNPVDDYENEPHKKILTELLNTARLSKQTLIKNEKKTTDLMNSANTGENSTLNTTNIISDGKYNDSIICFPNVNLNLTTDHSIACADVTNEIEQDSPHSSTVPTQARPLSSLSKNLSFFDVLPNSSNIGNINLKQQQHNSNFEKDNNALEDSQKIDHCHSSKTPRCSQEKKLIYNIPTTKINEHAGNFGDDCKQSELAIAAAGSVLDNDDFLMDMKSKKVGILHDKDVVYKDNHEKYSSSCVSSLSRFHCPSSTSSVQIIGETFAGVRSTDALTPIPNDWLIADCGVVEEPSSSPVIVSSVLDTSTVVKRSLKKITQDVSGSSSLSQGKLETR